MPIMHRGRLLAPLVAILAMPLPATADTVADFYRGRQMEIIIITSPGGDYDLRARLLARFMPKYIPGNPNIIPRNMPAAAGVVAANYVQKLAPRDGTTLFAPSQSLALHQAIGQKGLEADVRQLFWIGNTTDTPNLVGVWHTTGIKTVADATRVETTIASTGVASSTYVYPAVLNAIVGTKFKIVTGYPGGPEMDLAMEKGEVGGRVNIWVSWQRGHPDWIRDNKVYFLVQVGLKRRPELSEVPLMFELAKTPEDREVLALLSADTEISRAITATPGIPAERQQALRRAFDAATKDTELIAEAKRMGMELVITDGAAAQKVALSIVNAPAPLLARLKALVEPGGK